MEQLKVDGFIKTFVSLAKKYRLNKAKYGRLILTQFTIRKTLRMRVRATCIRRMQILAQH